MLDPFIALVECSKSRLRFQDKLYLQKSDAANKKSSQYKKTLPNHSLSLILVEYPVKIFNKIKVHNLPLMRTTFFVFLVTKQVEYFGRI